ncbi:phosphopantetheine-binding protein [Glycomyces sp. L485]|uniref:acyl carrier protein n=1 Tax=Glycomyces sp. L485 TaxID=2909235 RepID=UPI001F4B81FF|nr:phosphopantetheine-binding protein [Glycomyces sp. L485]MCH7230796.1 phosphopantetheine-binding protein [Glycomyces sp. L485]
MQRSELRSAVVEVLVRLLKVAPDIDPAADLADHGLTSLESVSLVLMLEDRFDIDLPDHALMLDNFTSVDKIVDLLNSHLEAEAQA